MERRPNTVRGRERLRQQRLMVQRARGDPDSLCRNEFFVSVIMCVLYTMLAICALLVVFTYTFWIGGRTCGGLTTLTSSVGALSTCDACQGRCFGRCRSCGTGDPSSCTLEYGKWIRYVWLIQPAPLLNAEGADISGPTTLHFGHFSLENPSASCVVKASDSTCCDAVVVYDGLSKNDRVLGTFCGSGAPPPVVASGRELRIEFSSDGESAGLGFSAFYTSGNFSRATPRSWPRFPDVYKCDLPFQDSSSDDV